jgi:hypothetical protein
VLITLGPSYINPLKKKEDKKTLEEDTDLSVIESSIKVKLLRLANIARLASDDVKLCSWQV